MLASATLFKVAALPALRTARLALPQVSAEVVVAPSDLLGQQLLAAGLCHAPSDIERIATGVFLARKKGFNDACVLFRHDRTGGVKQYAAGFEGVEGTLQQALLHSGNLLDALETPVAQGIFILAQWVSREKAGQQKSAQDYFLASRSLPTDDLRATLYSLRKGQDEQHLLRDNLARLYVQGMAPVGNSSADFAKAMAAESVRWATVVKNRKLAGAN